MTSYDEKFKLLVVQDYALGQRGFKRLARQYGLNPTSVMRWVKRYEEHGLEGLRKKRSHYSAQFKLSVLERMWREELSATQTAALFNIGGGPTAIKGWECQYHEGGLRALAPKPRLRGSPKKMSYPEAPKPSPAPSSDTRTLEDLRKENEYLRAEVAYLKKLRALLQAKEQTAQKKRG
jgi:transposase